jgi:hypothetical protein
MLVMVLSFAINHKRGDRIVLAFHPACGHNTNTLHCISLEMCDRVDQPARYVGPLFELCLCSITGPDSTIKGINSRVNL